MKKIFVMIAALALAFCLPLAAFAAEGEEVTTPDTEITTESENEPSAPEATPEETPIEDEEGRVSEYIERLTAKLGDSSIWVNLCTIAAALLAAFVYVKNKFGGLHQLLSGKADTAVITKKFDDKGDEIVKIFKSSYETILARLEAAETNEKNMWAILTIFMTHAKISPAVKSEIFDRITGIKEMNGSIAEIVEEAEKAIEKAAEANKSLAPETPTLDSIINTEETETGYMTL